jgi:ribonuclease P protein component
VKRIYSLKRRVLLREVFKKGKRFSTNGLDLLVLKSKKDFLFFFKNRDYTQYQKIRIGITVSGKYGNAVARNRAKRKIREICRELLPEMGEGYLMVFRPGADFKALSFIVLKENVKNLIITAGVIGGAD